MKAKKINKDTRKLIESISRMIKVNGSRNHIKFKKAAKKDKKKIQRVCPHWMIRGGELKPAVHDEVIDNHVMWKCGICKAVFPVNPKADEVYKNDYKSVLEDINQAELWLVAMGGSAPDIELISRLKKDLPRMREMNMHIVKSAKKNNRNDNNINKLNNDGLSDPFRGGFNFRY